MGISPKDQPPNHYRLLGIELFEASPDVIEAAADRQMTHLRAYQSGKHSQESQRLLNEVSAARVCLLDVRKKAAYDQQLRRSLQGKQPTSADQEEVPVALEFLDQKGPAQTAAPRSSKSRTGIYLAAAAGTAVTLLAVVSAAFYFAGGGSREPNIGGTAQTPEPGTPRQCTLVLDWPAQQREGWQLRIDDRERQFSETGMRVSAARVEVPLQPGRHTVRVRRPGFEEFQQSFDIAEGVRTIAPRCVVLPEPARPKVFQPEKPVAPPEQTADKPAPPGERKPPTESPPVKAEEPAGPIIAARQPVPDQASRDKALEAALESFKEDYEQAKTPAEKVAFAGKLREAAEKATGDPAERFVLLRLARDVATQALSAKAAFAAIDQMHNSFSIDDLAMKSEALGAMGGKAIKADDRKALAGTALDLVQHAVDAESLDVAQESLKLASALAGKVHDRDLTERVRAAHKQVAQNVKPAGDVQAARETLKDRPDDPDANLTLGKYLCFVRGEWNEGLKRLAAGSDEQLKAIAQQDLGSTAPASEECVKLGDAWWNVSRSAAGTVRERMMLRAGTWYGQAEVDLPAGLVRARVEKRLAEIEKLGGEVPELPAGPPPAVAPFDVNKAKSLQSRWARYLKVPVVQTNSIGMQVALIPPGEFDMGSPKEVIEEELKVSTGDSGYTEHLPAEGPPHRVRITKPFYLGVYAVTQADYEAVMGKNPSEFSGSGKQRAKVAGQDTSRFPVECVSWNDCVEFCRKLSNLPDEKAAGRRYRLPTEAQWEYACRAGTTGRFGFSPNDRAVPKELDESALRNFGWFDSNAGRMPHAVGGKLPNAWGLYDMQGNVWQFCQDRFDQNYYAASARDDPSGPASGTDRVFRGGAWERRPWSCRSACRAGWRPGDGFGTVGFRISLVVADE